jgi:mediator of RNA polymerase II transcription subunit 10
VPPELLAYVENGRNPDIYTREFVETVRRGNQLLKGKLHAFGSFRDVLAAEMAAAMPELRQDVDRVCEATGGKPPVVEGEGGAAEAGASGVAPPRAQDAAAAATAPGPSAPTPTPTPAPSSGA